MKQSYFIADLHLTENRPDITAAFFDFLDSKIINDDVDALYILGDFFEVWVGDDYQTDLSVSVATRLSQVSESGTKVFFIHGNRDFIMREGYAKSASMTLLPEQVVIDLYGTPTVILHGDEMCTQDVEYQKFRKKSRGWWWPKLMLAMPLWYRKKIARNAREKSKQSQAGKALEILDVTEDAVLTMFKKHQVKNMIHGHTHRPNVHYYNVNGDTHTRTVLGDWYEQGSYLRVTPDKQELIYTPL
ncbi:UDP-2,3-diacylglucosamine diphosphatase [Pseudoalteromonas sp. MEBiC 03607]|uniref:UDP-2,3-diacylglucosamine diphosphatase n=1 Tax=Pseudoalteromonas sp. MEBiC 03607 TaxID=2563601 RepID=UPI000C4D07D6|nr:UDP-2,3-diacylglucosamine diphosphatase [Pseudoalteromonas sp. MEBiC 03607]MBD58469.1 UDP-2,3-diacylglucosamine diphosphatase [Pseudoalteromonas sp.]TGV20012.1 UDP-2,3-diacylglucosamine diphosphatase [Pseudoalteromonas sp. MEBiC 03607]|tara:strand:+ start:817 stop:1548 length:732 start_codon:yes stop_codon:yes gene_type:complete